MAELAYRKLDESEIADNLGGLPEWRVESGMLTRDFVFDDYMQGIEFAGAVGRAAEELNHHPDIRISYRKVRVSVNTHDVGGISPYDFELARRINAVS